MNNCIFYGRIASDVEVRYTNSNMAVANFSLAIDRNLSKEKEKSASQTADFARILAFGQTAETIGRYFQKGSPILLVTHFQSGSYTDKDGRKVYTNEFVVDRFEFTHGSSRDNEGRGNDQRADRRGERRGSGRSQQRPPRQQRMDDYDDYDNLPSGFTEIDDGDIPF